MVGDVPAALSKKERILAMEEIWKDVVGFEGLYEVSNYGRIRSLPHETVIRRKNAAPYVLKKRGVIVTPQARRHGYLAVWLYGNGGNNGRSGKQYSVHRIVAEAFIPNPNQYEEVNHINEDKTDNRVCNLAWCSHRENSLHGTRGNRIGNANRNGKKSKPRAQYTLDGELVQIFPSFQEANRQGYGAGNIYKCIHGQYSQAYGYKWQYAS